MKPIFRIVLPLILSTASAFAQTPTLADRAREERARRKALESKVVIRETGAPAAAGATATTMAVSAGISAVVPKGPVDNKGRDEKYWRGMFDKARQDLKRSEDRLRLADMKVADISSQLTREGLEIRAVELRSSLEKARADQAAAKGDVEKGKQSLLALEEDLRRSGGLPGWAR